MKCAPLNVVPGGDDAVLSLASFGSVPANAQDMLETIRSANISAPVRRFVGTTLLLS